MSLRWRWIKLQQIIPVLVTVLSIGLGETQTCPFTCQCLHQSTICKGGDLMDILTNIPQDSSAVRIFAAKFALQLEHQHFNQCLAKYSLTELTISRSQVWKISDKAFSALTNLQKLNLSHNAISEISSSAFEGVRNLQQLDISNNRLSVIGSPISRLQSLEYLNVAQNNFRTISSRTFQAMSRLETLVLEGNHLSGLQGHSFQSLGNLQNLSLRGCGIDQIPQNLFYIIRKLQTLDLRFNHIKTIPNSKELRNLAFLRELYLDNNQITELQDLQFGSIPIDILGLSHNQIQKVSVNTFKYFNAKVVDLSFNKITWLHSGTFKPLAPEMTDLNLAGNLLTKIPLGVFDGLYRLEHLNLSRCNINSLPGNDFETLQQLRILDLSQNRLQNLSWEVTNRMKSLALVNIQGNPWHCDCYIQPLRDWLSDFSNRQKLVCSDQSSRKPASENSVNCWDVRCNSPKDTTELTIGQLADQQVAMCATAVSPAGLSVDNIVIIVSIIIATICISISIIVIMWKKKCFKRIFKHNVKPSKPPPYQPYTSDQASVDLGSINESDRGFPLRTYMQALEAMNGQFYDITPTESNPRSSDQYNGGSDFAVETQSRTCSSIPSTIIVGRESAV